MIIVSACLAGYRCRYDGKCKSDQEIIDLVKSGKAIPVCPEMLGGLPCPRVPAERTEDDRRVITRDGRDVTEAFARGARETLRLTQQFECDRAILKARSPSCGKDLIYNGAFSGMLRAGNGVTTELLLQHGITVETKD